MRNLLVAYNGLPASDAALRGAQKLRDVSGGHLTGLFAHGGASISAQVKPWMPANVKDALLDFERDAARDVQKRFFAGASAVPSDCLHWIESDRAAHATVPAYARLFDLTLLGVHERADGFGQAHIELFPDRIALESGRPVLVFPAGHDGDILSGRAVVAWDGGRAAARALADATALFGSSMDMEIVSVGRVPLARTLPGVDVRTILGRRGRPVALTELPRGGRSIAATIADHCEAVGARLLVMGAYEHSPLREDIFGGVTHEIAATARIPVLMSH